MMHNIPGQTIEWHDRKKYENAALNAQWLHFFIKIMRNDGSELVVSNRSLDCLTQNSFVYHFCNFLSDLKLLHINGQASVHLFKNGLNGHERNLNNKSYTSLLKRKKLFHFGSNDGSIDDEEEGGVENVEAKFQQDKFFVRHAITIGTYGAKTMKKEQQQYLMRSLIITRARAMSCLYLDTAIIMCTASGEKFFVKADGSAKHLSTNGAYSCVPGSGKSFCMPRDGTVLRGEPGSGYSDVIFGANNFVHATWWIDGSYCKDLTKQKKTQESLV